MKAKGFTLIELLVVITIIGILATGATALYTGAQQKARDSIRVTDITMYKSAFQQAYGDDNQYLRTNVRSSTNVTAGEQATAIAGAVVASDVAGVLRDRNYLTYKQDDKINQVSNATQLGYAYASGNLAAAGGGNATSGYGQAFEVSTGFEAPGNVAGKAATDGGNDDNRLELGNVLTLNTSVATDAITVATGVVDKAKVGVTPAVGGIVNTYGTAPADPLAVVL